MNNFRCQTGFRASLAILELSICQSIWWRLQSIPIWLSRHNWGFLSLAWSRHSWWFTIFSKGPVERWRPMGASISLDCSTIRYEHVFGIETGFLSEILKFLEIFIHFKIQIHCIGTVQPRVAVQSVPFVGPMMHCQLQWSLSVNTTPTLSVLDDLKVRSLARNSVASNVRPIMSTWHHWLIISSLVLLVPALFKMLTFMTAMPCWANTMVLFYLVTSIGRKWRTHSKVHRLNFEFWFFLVIFVVNSAVDLKCNKRGPKWPIFDLFLF